MIEFNGYLTGSAEKHYRKRVLAFGRKLLLISMLLVLPLILRIAAWVQSWGLVFIYIGIYFVIPPFSLS